MFQGIRATLVGFLATFHRLAQRSGSFAQRFCYAQCFRVYAQRWLAFSQRFCDWRNVRERLRNFAFTLSILLSMNAKNPLARRQEDFLSVYRTSTQPFLMPVTTA